MSHRFSIPPHIATVSRQAKQTIVQRLYQLCFQMIDKEILKLQWLMPILQQNKHTERSESMRHFDV
ncbi:MAG: hypothetical protein PF448_01585 [Bacteroidales bacterium]|jgi:hypothetical protein|nr:hypothetical protein [Bacteroidales bacterium]